MRTSLLLLLSVLCMAPAAAEDAGRPSYSAWYRFEGAQVAGVGETPWPAYPLGAGAGHGRFGGGLVLPGTGGNGLYLPNPAAFFGREASRGTIALWVKPAFSPAEEKGQRVVFDFMRDTGNTLVDGYQIVLFTDGDRLKAKPCLDRQMAIPNPLRKGEWTHLALAWDSSQGTALYVDGEKKAEIPAPFRPTELEAGWPGRVGCHTPGGGFAFAGTLDELRLFNTRLGEAEVRTLKGLDPARPQMVVIGDWVGGVTVANAGAAPAALSLQAWLPGRHAAPPHRGALPFPFGAVDPTADYWTAGVTPAERVAGPLTLAPGERRRLSIPTTPAYLGPRQVRLMAGEGLAAQEVASRTFAGLCVKPTHCRPLVVPDDRPASLPAHVTNDLGGPFAGSLRADVLDAAGKRVAGCALPVNLAAGKSVGVALALGQRLPLGAYRLRVRDGAGGVIEELPLFAARAGRPDRLCLVGASYVGAPDNPKVLSAMAADGVGVLRLHGKLGDAYSFEKNLSALLPHGFKVTRMAAASYRSVCTDPEKRRTLVATARSLGRLLRDNPAVINQVIGGEGLSAPPCYCAHCAAAFRDSLRREYATLHALNNAWGTAYKAWGDIQQIGSPRDIDETAERLKMMKVALDLPAENTARWRRLFSLDRTRAMAWKRWHERLLVDWYAAFARAFRETNGGRVPVGEQPCWPNFESHVLFALGDIAGMGGMDLYLPGEMATTLGYAAELFLNFDMNASIFASRGKPVMLHELYVQDNSPELLPEAQGWWLVGRGYNILTYFTYDYYYEGVRANQPLIFGLFGKTGKPYPAYPSFVRFGRALKEFDRRYGCATLGREHPRVALFMGDDVSLANNLESGGATWEAAGVKGHNGAYWLTERAGLPVEFVNDDGLDRLAGKKALVVPWCHVVRPASLEKMLAYARAGGTLLVDGPLGLYDHLYRPYQPQPGGAFAAALGIRFTGYADEPNQIVLADGARIDSQGVAQDAQVTRGTVLLKDAAGRPALVRVPVGKGQALLFLSSLGRRSLARNPDPNAVALWRSLLEERAGVRSRRRFTADAGEGKGSLVDVSTRTRGPRELFLFLTSFFAGSSGALDLDLPAGRYTAVDALTGQALPLALAGGQHRLAVALPAFGSRVVRVTAASGKPFAGW